MLFQTSMTDFLPWNSKGDRFIVIDPSRIWVGAIILSTNQILCLGLLI